MSKKEGKLSIHSENIFPIIKKWLYSDHDIFIRELTSNAADAISKMKHLVSVGEAENDQDYKIEVVYDKDNEILQFKDNGLGMTAEEIEEYINKIAFSGAEDFVKRFKDKGDEEQIIGHFGLGFYSAFMVAEKVTIDSLSYKEGSDPAFWDCDGGIDFKMDKGKRTERGTTISLFLSEDGNEFKNEYKIKNTLNKYCNFMPYPIYFESIEEKADDEKEKGEIKPINKTKPLYLENPSNVSDEDYKEFYRDTFVDFKEPLFWIHLNMDYPFRLKGILYFPKISDDFGELEGQIKLYNTQVYVADNIKEIIPEFLMLLKGVIDCPDMPLNVSRSFLQNDGFVKKISDYISKKVSDKLVSLFKTDRENYESYWDDIQVFIKFGILREDKFYSKVKDAVLYKNTKGEVKTINDIIPEEKGEEVKLEDKKIIYYTDNIEVQNTYIDLLSESGKEVFILDQVIDSAFINYIEGEHPEIMFKRVDSGVEDFAEDSEIEDKIEEIEENEKDDNAENSETEKVSPLSQKFRDVLGLEQIKVELKKLNNKQTPALIVLSEESRRIRDMMKMYSAGGNAPEFPLDEKLILNTENELIKFIIKDESNDDKKNLIIKQVYDLASLGNGTLSGKNMQEFLKRSQEILVDFLK